jgi:flagella basal body P-ring formation protein FlgA
MKKITTVLALLGLILGIYFPPEAESAARSQGYQTIPETSFRQIFERFLFNQWGKGKSDIVLSRMKVIGDRPVPPGKISYQLYRKGRTKLKGQVRLAAIIKVDGVVRNRVTLSGWVDVFESVLCASRPIKKGEILNEEDIHLVRRNISHLSSKTLTDMSQVVGMRTKHNLKQDTCIKEWMLEKSPLVDKGDMVTILAESGDLRVTVPGLVLEKGYLGGLIRVQNTMSKKEVHARIINHSTVAVDF